MNGGLGRHIFNCTLYFKRTPPNEVKYLAPLFYSLDMPDATQFKVKRPALDDFPMGGWVTRL